MKGSSFFAALLLAACLPLHANESHEDYIFQRNRCALAYGLGIHSDPSISNKSIVATGMYMRERGIQMRFAELTVINDKIMKEIMGAKTMKEITGAPDSQIEEWESRAQKITDSDFCKTYLSSLQSN
ncbi:hypothetical protein PSH58_18120 [Pseudomonas hefeiensis]|uniref:Uncharacterized protein n=1 Tax=Pseudomonas hefeiensis TaxID=2738125 RepID=A0ABY9G5M8_9PSED|nr:MULTISPECIES: hypothetical protein [unclassified Pseudomonas]WLH10794.1 hypothetical protein PSH57_18090 [Pseudomonas sp. FP205]WLH93875.1 hypothetical protein PSH58_18120 [Pseudomonas sp. FP53]WLI38150.1 hypothetical protein PSH74_18050 [Pseudomonas sp. FP821]